MDHHQTARLIAIGRLLLGSALLVFPARLARPILGNVGATGGGRVALRALGIRDLAIGVGALRALGSGGDVATWTKLGAACDAVDGAAMVMAGPDLGLARAVSGAAIAGTAAAVGWTAGNNVN